MSKSTKYEIRQAESFEEFKKGLDLLSSLFENQYGTYPLELPDQFFLAFDKSNGNKVVGTINLQTHNINKKLEVEKYFDLNLFDLYEGPATEVGEIGRLSSADKRITQHLLCAATLFAEKIGIKFFISFNKKFLARILTKKYFYTKIHSFPIIKDAIPEIYNSYFFDKDRPVVILTQHVNNWSNNANKLMQQNKDFVDIVIPDFPRDTSVYHEQFQLNGWSDVQS
jgi:hypothetical protein